MSKIKLSKTAYCGYIYEDRHAVIVHKEKHPRAGEVEWIEVFERIDALCSFRGRIVFHNPKYDPRLELALNAYRIRCTEPSMESGSENTKRAGIRVGYFEIEAKDGRGLSWIRTPDIISDGLTYQPEMHETFSDLEEKGFGFWGDKRIDVVHRVKSEVPTLAVA